MLDDWQMMSMQSTQEEALPDKVDIYRIVRIDDGFGGTGTQAAELVSDDVPCRATPAQTQMLGGQADRQLELEKWTVRVPVGQDIQDDDILVITTQGDEQLQVESAKHPKSWETVRTAMCEVVRDMTWAVA